jgi:ABC-type sugar transport system permease subunit
MNLHDFLIAAFILIMLAVPGFCIGALVINLSSIKYAGSFRYCLMVPWIPVILIMLLVYLFSFEQGEKALLFTLISLNLFGASLGGLLVRYHTSKICD